MVILLLPKNIMNRLTTDPIQNDIMVAERACIGPSIHPIPSMSLASPRPMARPRDMSQMRANGNAKSGPDAKDMSDGNTNSGPIPV